MRELTHTLYPVIFEEGTFGSSLAYFISLHDNFYPFVFSPFFRNNEIMECYEGVIHLPRNIDEINQNLKNINTSKKIVCKFFGSHCTFPKELLEYVGKKVFPIIIKSDNNASKFKHIRLLHEYRFIIDELQTKQELIESIDQSYFNSFNLEYRNIEMENSISSIIFNNNYKNYKDYFLTDILLFGMLLLYNSNSNSKYELLCNFIKSEKRDNYQKDLNEIDKITKYSEILKKVNDEFGKILENKK